MHVTSHRRVQAGVAVGKALALERFSIVEDQSDLGGEQVVAAGGDGITGRPLAWVIGQNGRGGKTEQCRHRRCRRAIRVEFQPIGLADEAPVAVEENHAADFDVGGKDGVEAEIGVAQICRVSRGDIRIDERLCDAVGEGKIIAIGDAIEVDQGAGLFASGTFGGTSRTIAAQTRSLAGSI